MTVNKRTRFEVLKRDGFRCYYCGTRGNEVTGDGLTIDHVVPVALGGTDDAENLVAACSECNSGKASVPADAALIAAVDQETARFKAARKAAMDSLVEGMESYAEYEDQVVRLWQHHAPSYKSALPAGWATSVYTWHASGVPLTVIEKGIRIALGNASVGWPGKWAYVAGVVRNTLKDAEDRTDRIISGDDPVYVHGYENGFHDGMGWQGGLDAQRDLLAMHIDGRTDEIGWQRMEVPRG